MPYSKEEIIAVLKENAQQYSRYAGKYLEFSHSRSRITSILKSTVYFGPENFMHLVGIRSGTCSAIEFYTRCLDKSITIEDCTPTHDIKNRNEKIFLFPLLFDFSNSKIYKIGKHDLSTAYDDFALATGNGNGIIGYDYRNHNINYPIPVTLLGKPISHYCSEVHKIIAVVQKSISLTEADTVIYEVKAGVYNSLNKT